MTQPVPLLALTPLRFIAAAMVFLHHAIEMPGWNWSSAAASSTALSFFFVLSGFILTHAYPELDAPGSLPRFYRARAARLLPAYLAALVVGFILLRYPPSLLTLLPFLSLTQAWIPSSNWYFSYNAVAWSVSTEAFFYLAFPFLLRDLDRNCGRRLASAAALLAAMILVAVVSEVPAYRPPASTPALWQPDITGLLYTNPLARLLEFTSGMVAASIWRRARFGTHRLAGTGWEILMLLALAVTSQQKFGVFRAIEQRDWMMLANSAAGQLLQTAGIACTIVVFANARGVLSRLLSHPGAVYLGDISFSFYLVHQIVLYVWMQRFKDSAGLSVEASILLVFVASLICASLMRHLVEVPGQRWLKGLGKARGAISGPLVPARRTDS